MSVLRVWRARSGCLACWMFNRDAGGSAGPAGARHGGDLRKCLFSPFWPHDLILIGIQAAEELMDDKTYENDHLELDQPPMTLSTRHGTNG